MGKKSVVIVAFYMRIVLIDNYDSFTYNLLHLLRDASGSDADIDIVKNDAVSLSDIARYDKIVISPGPGIPSEAGCVEALIRRYSTTHPILGICLGHQAIASVFGASLICLPHPVHGGCSKMEVVDHAVLFRDLPDDIMVARYHSWAVDEESLPSDLAVTARAEGLVMALSHRRYDIHGVQFHPESFCTDNGVQMVRNFLYR